MAYLLKSTVCSPPFMSIPVVRGPSHSRSLGMLKVCRRCTTTTGTTSSRESELHGTRSNRARRRFARGMESSTTGYLDSCWDLREGIRLSSRCFSLRFLVHPLAPSPSRFRLHFYVCGRRFLRDFYRPLS